MLRQNLHQKIIGELSHLFNWVGLCLKKTGLKKDCLGLTSLKFVTLLVKQEKITLFGSVGCKHRELPKHDIWQYEDKTKKGENFWEAARISLKEITNPQYLAVMINPFSITPRQKLSSPIPRLPKLIIHNTSLVVLWQIVSLAEKESFLLSHYIHP